ncbi:MAG: tRNA (adenosine(37)-N6)-dimethylallyltransferase MiaA [Patescibacteria group bacterium]
MITEIQKLIEDFKDAAAKDDVKPLLVILGPTASGKTALSLKLARQFDGEIISADSRQVYKHMDIGTDKIPTSKREGVAHHLLDVAEPSERFTVADFKRLAEEKIEEILARGKLPMLVGGTGLYLRAVTENFLLPPKSEVIQKEMEKELKIHGAEALHKKLAELDPKSAKKIHVNNLPYVMRALEIALITGRPKDDQQAAPRYRCLKIGLNWPREELFQRIHERIDEQFKNGLLQETQKLLEMGLSRSLSSMRSLGYREAAAHLAGEISQDDAHELLKKNTRNYAKRQMTWFRKETDIHWFSMPDAEPDRR